MLRQLGANDPRFKSIRFEPGLNVLVAEKTTSSTDTDSRNGAGKSSVVQLLHYLLGARQDTRSLFGHRALADHVFELSCDWPNLNRNLTVRRAVADPNGVQVSPDPSGRELSLDVPARYSLTDWQRLIERDLFSLPAEHSGVSGRAMLSLYLRRVGSNSFNDAIKTTPQQSPAEASANIAYLLGLDWRLAARYRDLANREATRRRLTQATKDPIWGNIVGRSSELRGQITNVQQRVSRLEAQAREFQVVPEYENLRNEADEIAGRIRRLRDEEVVDRRNLKDYQAALKDSVESDTSYLESVYADLGVVLGDAVRRRYNEVEEFHRAVIRNRREHLEGEISSIQERLIRRAEERARLGEQQSAILRSLNEGGALDTLTALQSSLAQERAGLEALRHRYEAALTLEASAAEIKAARGLLESETRLDLRERETVINEVNLLFLEYASRLYGQHREAYLDIDPTPTHLKILPHIDSRNSRGIGNMIIFCFDLTVAVTAHRAGRGPDFLVHDSHLFDGVDERQLAHALTLAAEVADAESMQYVVTLNSDDLSKAAALNPGILDRVIEPRLTDSLEDGGLFGFRFS